MKAEKRVIRARWSEIGYRSFQYIEEGTGRIIGSVDGEYQSWAAHQNMNPSLWVQLGSFQTEHAAKQAVIAACAALAKRRKP